MRPLQISDFSGVLNSSNNYMNRKQYTKEMTMLILDVLFFRATFYLETNISLIFNIMAIWENTISHF